MDSAVSLLHNSCSFTQPGVPVTRIAEQNIPGGHPGQSLAAVITEAGTSPTIAHVYLISDLRNSTVVELAMWSTSPPAVDWPTINDDQLLADMVAPLCVPTSIPAPPSAQETRLCRGWGACSSLQARVVDLDSPERASRRHRSKKVPAPEGRLHSALRTSSLRKLCPNALHGPRGRTADSTGEM